VVKIWTRNTSSVEIWYFLVHLNSCKSPSLKLISVSLPISVKIHSKVIIQDKLWRMHLANRLYQFWILIIPSRLVEFKCQRMSLETNLPRPSGNKNSWQGAEISSSYLN
jgi:hypothetical protein